MRRDCTRAPAVVTAVASGTRSVGRAVHVPELHWPSNPGISPYRVRYGSWAHNLHYSATCTSAGPHLRMRHGWVRSKTCSLSCCWASSAVPSDRWFRRDIRVRSGRFRRLHRAWSQAMARAIRCEPRRITGWANSCVSATRSGVACRQATLRTRFRVWSGFEHDAAHEQDRVRTLYHPACEGRALVVQDLHRQVASSELRRDCRIGELPPT